MIRSAPNQAIALYEESHAEAYTQLGNLADRTGKPDEAATFWKGALEAYATLEKSPGLLDDKAQRVVDDLKKRVNSIKR